MSAGEGFWAFSVRVYGEPAVPPACLALQNTHGLDVNLLLYCCWLGTRGVQLDAATLARSLDFATPWAEHVVRPLRHARTWMKHDGDARERLPPDIYAELRESIKTVELEAERLQQLALEAMTEQNASRSPSAKESASCATENLRQYLSVFGVDIGAEVSSHLSAIVNASTGIEPAEVVEELAANGRTEAGSADG